LSKSILSQCNSKEGGIRERDEQTIRVFLSGELRLAMRNELQTAADGDSEIYAASFELDVELIAACVHWPAATMSYRPRVR
jgi:hypothetical protein